MDDCDKRSLIAKVALTGPCASVFIELISSVVNDRLELHLGLGPERLDELLAELAAQVQDSAAGDFADLESDGAEWEPLGQRTGGKVVRATRWPTADR
ncbi:hypothetical protein ACFRQM_40000 [Streptomyces sp. NPDC056831]|uniref:hypothetical protein n=1 Tax=Streptomyces sp. NPDC056831 TaxID=3345954 RepID=UPI0036BF25A4